MLKLVIQAIITLLIIIIGVCFAFLNAQHVSFNYYLGTADVPLSLLLVLALGLGFLLGLCCCVLKLIILNSQMRHLKRALKKDA